MRIIRMTATFGKLDNATLELKPGLNVITAPNEWGKSTWCAFLTAMLYGVDTRERSSQDRLADKEKYAPWSGKPMEGILRLEHEGRDITIQRRTRGRVPMGDFLAYETMTGVTVEGLTAENCGQVLLGVERSVFRRTGFIRFSDLPVAQDEALRHRLNALVTTGDESGRAEALAKNLRELKNKCRYHRTGLIPETQTQIRTLQEQLRERETLESQRADLEDRIARNQNYLDQLEIHRSAFAWREAQEDKRRVEAAAQTAKFTRSAQERMEEKCEGYPERGELIAKLRQANALLEQIGKKRQEKPASPAPVIAAWAAAALLAVLAFFMWTDHEMAGAAVAAVLAIAVAIGAGILTGRRRRTELERRMELQQLENRARELTRATEQWNGQLADLEELEQARQEAEKARVHLQNLLAMARSAARPTQTDELELSREETMEQLGATRELLQRARMQLAQYGGRMESLPDREILEGKLELAARRLRQLELTYRALDYGQKALDAAMQELQRRFAPRITRRAGQFLGRLTAGQYDRIAIDDDLSVRSAREEESTLRTPHWRSDGTADQMYLALRLAVWEVLSPNAPLVLDDALVRFDRERLANAMELLKELSAKRQIILFSCQEREQELV